MGTGKTYSTKYLLDSNNNSGVAGQVLSTTSTGIDWVDANTVPGTGLWLASGNNIYNSNSANVGIGTTSPSKKLEVAGSYKLGTNAYIQYDASYPYTISTLNTAAVGNLIFTAGAGSSGYESGITLQGSNTASDDGITFTAGSSAAMVIQVNGNVGIGTTSPLALLSVGSGSLADTNVAVQISTSGGTSQKWFGVNKNGSYGLLMGYLEGGSIGDGGAGAYIRNITEDPLYFMVSNSDLAMTILANKNVGIGTTSPDAKLTVSNGGAAGLEFFPEYTTNNNLINSYNRSSTAYLTIETRASEHYWDIGTTNKMSLNSSGNLNVNGEIQGDSFSGPGQGLDNLLPLGVYSTTPGTAGVLIKTNIASNNYGFIFGTINLEQFNFTSVQRIQLSATVASNGTVVTKAATSDIAITMKLFHVGGYWHIHLPTASTYVTASAYIYTGAGYQGQAKGFNEVNTITVNPVPSGATSSVDIVADVYVTTGSAGGSGPFLPLSAGSSYPLTGDLYYNGSIRSTAPASKLILSNSSTTTELHAAGSGGIAFKDSGNNTKMVIDSSGNVGIGTTSPANKLVVSVSTAGDYAALINNTNSTNGYGLLARTASTGTSSYAFAARADSSDIFVVRADGNVGIGTTSPSRTLHVSTDSGVLIKGASGSTNAKISLLPASGGRQYDLGNVGSDFRIFDASASVTRMYFDNDGNTGIGTTSPDTKLEVRTDSGAASANSYFRVTAGAAGAYGGTAHFEGAYNDYGNVNQPNIVGKIDMASEVVTTTDVGGTMKFFTKATGGTYATAPIERMRITSAGNVGIGTTSPTSKLFITAADGEMVDTYMVNILNQESTAGDNFGVQIRAGLNTSDVSLNVANKDGSSLFRVRGDGNVGIGTTNPGNKLSIQGSQATVYNSTDSGGQAFAGTTINNTNTAGNTNNFSQLLFTIGTNNNSVSRIVAIRSGSDASDLAFVGESTAGVAEYMRIKSGGNVGIGINNPSALLEVRKGSISGQIAKFSAINPHVVIESSTAGNAVLHLKPNATSSKSGQFKVTAGNGYNFRWSNDASGTAETAYMDLDTSTTGGGDLTVKGDVIAYGSPSDKKYKENIKPIESALDKAMQLQGVTFDWKDSESILEIKEDIGFIAQDVQEVLPELVRDNGKGNLSLRYQGITPILLEAIKELKAEIEELKLNNCNCNK